MNNSLKNRIMLQIYAIYFMRKLSTPFIGESLAFVFIGVILFYFVSIPSVISNMMSSGDFYSYFMMAFSNTDFVVKSILLLALIPAIFFIRNITIYTGIKERLA